MFKYFINFKKYLWTKMSSSNSMRYTQTIMILCISLIIPLIIGIILFRDYYIGFAIKGFLFANILFLVMCFFLNFRKHDLKNGRFLLIFNYFSFIILGFGVFVFFEYYFGILLAGSIFANIFFTSILLSLDDLESFLLIKKKE
jgi:hypothetical protein